MDPFMRQPNPIIKTTPCLFTSMTQHDVTCDVTNRIDIDRYFQLMKDEMSRLKVDDGCGDGREFRRSWSGSRAERRKRKERDPKKRLSCSDADDVSEKYKRQFKRFDENTVQQGNITNESRLMDFENPAFFRFIDPNLRFEKKENSSVRNRRRSTKRSVSLNSDPRQKSSGIPLLKQRIDPLDLSCQNYVIPDVNIFRNRDVEREKQETVSKNEDSQSDNENIIDESRVSVVPHKTVRSMRRWKSVDACVQANVRNDDDFSYINFNVFEQTPVSQSSFNVSSTADQPQIKSRSRDRKERKTSIDSITTDDDICEQELNNSNTNNTRGATGLREKNKQNTDASQNKEHNILLGVPQSEYGRHRSHSWTDNFKSRHRDSAKNYRRQRFRSKSNTIEVGEISDDAKIEKLLENILNDDDMSRQLPIIHLSCSPETKSRSRSRERKMRKTSINSKIVEDVISEQEGENNEERSQEVHGDKNRIEKPDNRETLSRDNCTDNSETAYQSGHLHGHRQRRKDVKSKSIDVVVSEIADDAKNDFT